MGISITGARLWLTFFSDGKVHRKVFSCPMSPFTVLYFVGIITLLLFAKETALSLIGVKNEFCANKVDERENKNKIGKEIR
jgi:hypothetical protein